MVNSLRSEMALAAEHRIAYILLIQQAVENILAVEQRQTTAAEQDETMDQAIDNLLGAIPKVRIADIAPAIQRFAQTTTSNNLRIDVLEAVEGRTDLPNSSINENVIDYLALASIYDEDDAHKVREYNALAYYFLGQGQNNKIADIVDTLEHIQRYTSDDSGNAFRLTEQQKTEIEQIVKVKTKNFLASGSQDAGIAERLANLGAGIKAQPSQVVEVQSAYQQPSQPDGSVSSFDLR